MRTTDANKDFIGRRCEYAGSATVSAYRTLIVTFVKDIRIVEGEIFDDPQAWGTVTLREWIDGYESTRFTQIDDRTAVITSEYNMKSVLEWLEKHTRIETLKIA